VVVCRSDLLPAVVSGCLRWRVVVWGREVACGREWLSAVASGCLRYEVVVVGREWLSAVVSGWNISLSCLYMSILA
jgi:hypothetical protein